MSLSLQSCGERFCEHAGTRSADGRLKVRLRCRNVRLGSLWHAPCGPACRAKSVRVGRSAQAFSESLRTGFGGGALLLLELFVGGGGGGAGGGGGGTVRSSA